MDTTINTDTLAIRRVPVDSLTLDPANARAHGATNLEAIASSLRRFGQAEPLVVRREAGVVIAGNGRLMAMKKLGWSECDVVELDVDSMEATALAIALNRTAELAEWDEGTLARLLSQLQAEDGLDGVGFTADEVALLLRAGEEEVELDDTAPIEPPEDPVSRAGDLWLLGDNRLLCGDSTNAEDVERLMGNEKADLVWSDPPFGVSYSGKAGTIANDDLTGDTLERFLGEALGQAFQHTRAGAVWYVAAPAGPQFLQFAKVLDGLGVWRQTLVWAKDSLVLGHSDFHYRHEAVFYGWTPGAAHREPPDRKQDTVWEFARPKVSESHPTMKPLELVAHAMRMSSVPGEVVLDPFMGSGTTLIAAESLGRKARGLELDPRYTDVIVQRWQDATGSEARLEGGDTFAEVTVTRRAG